MAVAATVMTVNAQGSKDAPMSVDDILEGGVPAEAIADTYVQGYIVGWVDGASLKDGAHFEVPATSNTNLLIAASSSETDYNYCIPVQLPVGDIRVALNLKDHPENLGHEIVLGGSCEKYFGVVGLKGTFYSAWVGDAPTGGTTVTYETGTEASPLSVSVFQEQGTPTAAVADTWLEGYIVGYIPGKVFDEGVLGNDGTEEAPVVTTNIMIAATATPATLSECIPVQLPAGDIRTGLNLLDNPGNLGKKVVLRGSHEAFFGQNGLKAVDTYILDGKRVTTAAETGGSVKSVAETIALADNTNVTIGYDLTVAFVNAKNVFACDKAGNFIQVYGTNTYKENDIIPAGWEATYKLYNGVTPELMPVTTLPESKATGKFTPKFVHAANINNDLVNSVIIIPGVTFAAATPDTKDNFDGEAEGVQLSFRNNYTKPGVQAGTYNVEVLVTIYNGQPSLYVLNFFDPTGVEEVVVANDVYGVKGGVVAPQGARVFNLSGVETGVENLPAGIYVVVVEGKAVKVAVK